MMNLKEIRKAYEELSGILSSVVRQINFAGIAIIWIFVDKDKMIDNQGLLNASIFLVASMVLDVLQYFINTCIWHICYTYNHKKDLEDTSVTVNESEWINSIPWACLYLKSISTGIGYYFILRFLANRFCL